MDFSYAGAAPSIRVYDSNPHIDRYAIPRRASYVSSRSSATSSPMSIPNARESPPPPLPPPRHISELANGRDPGWQWGNSLNIGHNQLSEVKPGSSLLGYWSKRPEKSVQDEEQNALDFARRGSSTSTIKVEHDADVPMSEGDGSGSAGGLDYSLRSDYDKQLLSKIGGPNTSKRAGNALSLSTGSQDAPLSQSPTIVSERRQMGGDPTLSRWSSISSSGPTSPESRRAQRLGSASTIGTTDETTSHRGSYDHSVFSDHDFPMDDSGMKDLNINDRSPSLTEDLVMAPKAGQKRRADSPQRREERSSTSSNAGMSELFRRRSVQPLQFARNSPGARLHTHQGSVSSTSSLGPRNSSFASSYGLSVASSATSYSSERLDRFSPGALSPSADPDLGPSSPYGTSRSLNPSPRGSLSAAQQQLAISETAPTQRSGVPCSDGQSNSRQGGLGKTTSMFICECCPKKPKKFETAEELRLHTMEKQYTCAFCPNRFKNKNEAERHQNSLHLRKHSWSCNALTGPEAAFTPGTNTASAADVCGYCGEEFPTPPDWSVRTDHLNRVHKYLECNQNKKFYRADHFRQHLKHSHAGTSGKWTNMLENACMRDEPLSKEHMPSVSSVSSSVAGSSTAGSAANFMAPPATMTVPGAPKHEVINESHEES